MSENGLHKIPVMRAALEAIQELHRMVPCEPDCCDEGLCWTCADTYPCPTRKLADEGLNPKPKSAIHHRCPECKGAGKITVAGQIMPGRDFYTKKCIACRGTGRIARTNQGENNE